MERSAKKRLAVKRSASGDKANQFGRCAAPLAEGTDGERVVALGEAFAFVVGEQRAVVPGGWPKFERAIEQKLAGGGFEQVGSADDFGDAHSGIVDDAGELVGGHAVATPDEEVAEVVSGEELLRAEVLIVERDGFAVGNAEAPVNGGMRCGKAAQHVFE